MMILVSNALGSPVRFRMEPGEQIRAVEQIESEGLEIVAIFHSHPKGPPFPSPTDIAESAYPVVNIIWSPVAGVWQARGFWIADGAFDEVRLEILE